MELAKKIVGRTKAESAAACQRAPQAKKPPLRQLMSDFADHAATFPWANEKESTRKVSKTRKFLVCV
jgi:hypothetical protein